MKEKRKKVLVCPLEWGLGHATRCIPIIKLLLEEGADVYVGADKGPYQLLIREFPTVKFITFPGLRIKYPRGALFIPFMFVLFPKMLLQIIREHRFLKELIKEYNFDIVISDNRYGLWSRITNPAKRKVKTVFMTHQVVIKTNKWLGFLSPIIFAISKYFINKYDQLWIPDVEVQDYKSSTTFNLSGDLGHSYLIKNKTRFIGILSRFAKPLNKIEDFKYDLCVIISGPEPQRTKFEKLIIKEIEKTSLHAVIIRGIPDQQIKPMEFKNGIIYPHLNTEMMQAVIEASKIVISRSGYSTIMDLAVLGKQAIFIPTPGQTEQIYLAEMLMKKGLVYYQKQQEFDLQMALIESKSYKGLEMENNPDSLADAIRILLA